MFPLLLMALLPGAPSHTDRSASEIHTLLDTIDALRQPVEDFRCEFEGTIRFTGRRSIEKMNLVLTDGLQVSYSGIFIWDKGGNIYTECLRRFAANGQVVRDVLVIRMGESKAEHYRRYNNQSAGAAYIDHPDTFMLQWISEFPPLFLFFRDSLRWKEPWDAEHCRVWITDDTVHGRAAKVVNRGFNHMPGSLLTQYWVDLKRNGNVVRAVSYNTDSEGKWARSCQREFNLGSFQVGEAVVWMPVSVKGEYFNPDPSTLEWLENIETFQVVNGSMEFNKHPGPEVFTIKYKPGTPISDNLRKLRYEFGQQKISPRPTKAEAEKMLNEQVAEAERQKKELVASPTEGVEWSKWLTWGFGGLVVVSSIFLGIQRRGH